MNNIYFIAKDVADQCIWMVNRFWWLIDVATHSTQLIFFKSGCYRKFSFTQWWSRPTNFAKYHHLHNFKNKVKWFCNNKLIFWHEGLIQPLDCDNGQKISHSSWLGHYCSGNDHLQPVFHSTYARPMNAFGFKITSVQPLTNMQWFGHGKILATCHSFVFGFC